MITCCRAAGMCGAQHAINLALALAQVRLVAKSSVAAAGLLGPVQHPADLFIQLAAANT